MLTADEMRLDAIRKSPVASVPVATVQKPFKLNMLYDAVSQAMHTLNDTSGQEK